MSEIQGYSDRVVGSVCGAIRGWSRDVRVTMVYTDNVVQFKSGTSMDDMGLNVATLDIDAIGESVNDRSCTEASRMVDERSTSEVVRECHHAVFCMQTSSFFKRETARNETK